MALYGTHGASGYVICFSSNDPDAPSEHLSPGKSFPPSATPLLLPSTPLHAGRSAPVCSTSQPRAAGVAPPHCSGAPPGRACHVARNGRTTLKAKSPTSGNQRLDEDEGIPMFPLDSKFLRWETTPRLLRTSPSYVECCDRGVEHRPASDDAIRNTMPAARLGVNVLDVGPSN